MTKAEELKLLEHIDALIKSADDDSYIHETFDRIVEICRNNIVDDFANHPVHDLEMMRTRCDSEIRMHDETKRMLSDAQKMCKEVMDENDRLLKLSAEWEQNAHDAGDLYCELEKECAKKDVEICNLKAEIVRMKLDRMTDVEYAELYECVKGVE